MLTRMLTPLIMDYESSMDMIKVVGIKTAPSQ